MSKIDKEGVYFPHFSNARNDRKIRRLRKDLGVEGYGIFMMLLEILRDQPDLRYPVRDIDLLESEIGATTAKIEVVIRRYELFEIDDACFYSPRLFEYLEPYFKAREQRSLAGKRSGESRRLRAISPTNDQQSMNDRSSFVELRKEKKRKEKKELLGQFATDVAQVSSEKAKKETTYPDDFERAWQSYNRKGSKKLALVEWLKLSADEKQKVAKHAPQYVASTEPKFVKDFERYLKHGKFESEVIEQKTRASLLSYSEVLAIMKAEGVQMSRFVCMNGEAGTQRQTDASGKPLWRRR